MIVAWLNLMFASVAAVANLYAALRVAGWMRAMFTFVAGLAALYAGSFVWLLLHYDQASAWSATMRPIAMVSWLVPWSAMPLLVVRRDAKFGRHLVEQAEQIVGAHK